MESRLQYILNSVNEWLKFAESKNAALVIAVCALLFPILDHLPSAEKSGAYRLCIGGSVLIATAGLAALTSFLPVLRFQWAHEKAPQSAVDNLLFFAHLAKYDGFQLLEALYAQDGNTNPRRKNEVDLAAQIVMNARIATAKFRCFQLAVSLGYAGFGLLGLGALMAI